MNNIRNQEFIDYIKRHGYDSQRSLARAIVERGVYFTNINTIASYFTQVVGGMRPASNKLIEAILDVCEGDQTIRGIFDITITIKSEDNRLERLLNNKFEKLYEEFFAEFRREFREGDLFEKMRIISDFENCIRTYFSREVDQDK